ncbi:MAG: CDP-diacylglycerol--serine O-phosphatidyltransferase [Caldimicrobium thiodismutans]|uniref:CDP-diacylglycerol--serine O-phosphatidyltransferase n=1 Tax=Caldimicrobium thiodismutans TaxID=1653476 RepID=A0A2N7PK77_9BACT|nr:MAG: CDP-diacylglycerol--serine O-phosphatidyltransferase [Caldimicrobium thiodismutans]
MFYLLPGIFTTLNLFGGFYALLASFEGKFLNSAVAIWFSILFDILDGRIARLSGQTSKFGKEYDSLADMVSFGLAPSFLIYNFSLKDFSKIGWLACFLYTACVALRLARFNVKEISGFYFEGLPSPAGGAIISATVLFLNNMKLESEYKNWILLIMVYILSYLFVSPIRYPSFKGIKLKTIPAFYFLVGFVLLLVITATNPPLILLILATLYILLGPFIIFKKGMKSFLKKILDNKFKKNKN